MIREQRIEEIRLELKKTGIVSVVELTKRLDASRSTIRRDLDDMEQEKLLRCIRGGAVSLPRQSAVEPIFTDRQDLFGSEKMRIAQRAAELIEENATIFLDSGTTVYELAKLLACRTNLHIATNDLNSAVALSTNLQLSVIVLGGILRANQGSMNGIFTEELVRQIHADITFLSVDAVNAETGLMGFSLDEISSKRSMIRSSRQTIVLCDHSKFENVAFADICPLRDIKMIITGKEANPEILAEIEEQGIAVLTV